MSALPFKVKAIYDYSSPHEDDLSFPAGQVITVTEEEDTDWYVGEYTDASGAKTDGLFPRNFVEKYEPEAPPRPSRPRPKKETAPPKEAPQFAQPEHAPSREPEISVEQESAVPALAKAEPVAGPTTSNTDHPPEPKPVSSLKAPSSPPVEKPITGSFKDRIAAFNKPSAPPIVPKPAGPPGGGGSTFIKKPFVAPPPSKDAYIPPPRQPPPQKVYRRDEDPEIAERQAQDVEDSEKAGLTGGGAGETGEEDAPKQTSLKDRIAVLQKQQQEQAARRAELAAKDKPPKPPAKRTESGNRPRDQESGEKESILAEQRSSVDSPREVLKPSSRTPTLDPKSPVPVPSDQVSDGNEADQSGAGETTEDAGGTSTEVDESDEKAQQVQPTPSPRVATGSSHSEQHHDASELGPSHEQEDEEEEDDDIDPEERRKMELRARMAKMSGGMGMAGMFGSAGSMPMAGAAPKKTRGSGASRDIEATTSPPPAQRIPMIPMPVVPKSQSPIAEAHNTAVEQEPEFKPPATTERPPEFTQDVEDLEPQPSAHSHDRQHPPPIPQGKICFLKSIHRPGRHRKKTLLRSESIESIIQHNYVEHDGQSEMPLMLSVFKRPLPPAPPSQQRAQAPPLPGNRPVPPTAESRAVPPPPPNAPRRQSDGAESDEEIAKPQRRSSGPRQFADGRTIPGAPPSIPGLNTQVSKPDGPRSPPSNTSKRASYKPLSPPPVPSSPSAYSDQRASRAPPLTMDNPHLSATNDGRAPPPTPPSAAPPSRKSKEDSSRFRDESEGGESDYEGDYDTDIASGAHHKDALKAHAREPSLDETTLSEEPAVRSGAYILSAAPPPIPPTQRAAPPPPPYQVPPTRKSSEAPRAPPPMPPRGIVPAQEEGEYDPYRYAGPQTSASRKLKIGDDLVRESDPSLYSISPQTTTERVPPMQPQKEPQQKHAVPPPLPPEHTSPTLGAPEQRQSQDLPRRSLDPPRRSMTAGRASSDQPRLSDDGHVAQDVDLAPTSLWWTHANTPPPVFQNRPDVLLEFEESTTSKRGGRTTVSRDVYVLFYDYSQTIMNVRYDPKEPAATTSSTVLEQRHEPPPPRPRQDELEAAHTRFGEPLFAAASARQNTAVGDGSPQALIAELLRTTTPGALMPVGTRAFGALVYANMANASVQLHDEIRPGDVVTLRNARMQGKHGAMHAKYSLDVREHVGIVAEWDGTKKKIRAFEQGREGTGKEGRKVRLESWKVGDLRGGEVRVWRVFGREWVGWDGGS